jgi:hypothetical protein
VAISVVVKPPTPRRVRAIAEDEVRAGWQHMNSKISVSSGSMVRLNFDGRDDNVGLSAHRGSLSRRAISLRT